MERLQKVLAASNVCSRRKAEEIILAGRIKVNGEVITILGYKVSKTDKILVDNQPITKAEKVYFLMNKPRGCVSTVSDEKKRKTVLDLLEPQDLQTRVYPVGRLDFDTAGLLILTNDGELANLLMHPKFEVEKEYLVRVEGIVIKQKIRDLRQFGIKLKDNTKAKVKQVRILELDKTYKTTLLSITLTEGKNHEVKNIFEALGHPVKKLTRIRYDFLTLDINRGSYRPLKPYEIIKLKNVLANK